MKKFVMFASVLICAACSPTVDASVCDPAKYGLEECPGDVAKFLNVVSECNHWGGEELYDDARRVEIEAAVKDLNCGAMRCDYPKLADKYKDDEKTIALLNGSLNEITGETPETYKDATCE